MESFIKEKLDRAFAVQSQCPSSGQAAKRNKNMKKKEASQAAVLDDHRIASEPAIDPEQFADYAGQVAPFRKPWPSSNSTWTAPSSMPISTS
jgi:hypothetical protein